MVSVCQFEFLGFDLYISGTYLGEPWNPQFQIPQVGEYLVNISEQVSVEHTFA